MKIFGSETFQAYRARETLYATLNEKPGRWMGSSKLDYYERFIAIKHFIFTNSAAVCVCYVPARCWFTGKKINVFHFVVVSNELAAVFAEGLSRFFVNLS